MLYETRCDYCKRDNCEGCPEYNVVILTQQELESLLDTKETQQELDSLLDTKETQD